MTETLNQKPAAESMILDRIYTAAIIALAATLILLALCRPKSGEITVNAAMNMTQESEGMSQPVSAQSLQNEIRQTSVVKELLAKIDPEVLKTVANSNSDWWVSSVAQSLSVESDGEDGENGTRLILKSKGVNEPFQLALLGQVQEYFEENYHRPTGADNSQTENRWKENVAAAVEQLDSIQTELKAFTTRRVRDFRDNYQSQIRAEIHRFVQSRQANGQGFAATKKRRRNMPVVTAVNPEWSEIEAELVRLRETETDKNHWSVSEGSREKFHDAVDQIADRIKTTPQTVTVASGIIENPFFKKKQAARKRQEIEAAIENSSSDLAELDDQAIDELVEIAMQEKGGATNPPESSMTPEPQARERLRKTLRVSKVLAKIPPFDELTVRGEIEKEPEFRDLIAKFNAARDARDSALDALGSQAPVGEVAAAPISVVSNLKNPAVVKRRRNFSRNFLLRMLTPCLLLGMLCGLATSQPKPPSTFVSPEDAENWLDFPVIGSVTTSDGPLIPTPASPSTPGYVHVLRRIAEGVVCLSLVAILYAVITMTGFGKEFIGNPLAGYTEAVDHITSWMS